MRFKFKNILIILSIIVLLYSPKSYGSILEYIDVRVEINKNWLIDLDSPEGFAIKNKEGKIIASSEETSLKFNKLNNDYGQVNLSDSNIKIKLDGSHLISNRIDENMPISVNGKKYRGNIKFLSKPGSTYIINHIKIDQYLKGVLPKETYASGPMELLKAQALASRSFLESNRNKHMAEGYNLCNTTHCQVYGAYDGEKPRTNLAVEATEGEYVLYNGRVANTVYHSSSGGHTEDSENVWGEVIPHLRGVEDPFSSYGRNSSWEYDVNPTDIRSKLASRKIYIGNIRGVKIDEVSKSGRVKRITIVGDKGSRTMTGNEFRNLLGTMNLKSTLFSLEKISQETTPPELEPEFNNYTILDGEGELGSIGKDSFYIDGVGQIHKIIGGEKFISANGDINTIVKEYKINKYENNNSSINTIGLKLYGKGFGHGVGMSQQGAYEMAEKGYSYKDILHYYYTDIEIKKIN